MPSYYPQCFKTTLDRSRLKTPNKKTLNKLKPHNHRLCYFNDIFQIILPVLKVLFDTGLLAFLEAIAKVCNSEAVRYRLHSKAQRQIQLITLSHARSGNF